MSGGATELERQGDAFVACFAAWLYPGDPELRQAAAQGAGLAGTNYIESIAAIMEGTAADANQARRLVAGGFLERVNALVDKGEQPRPNALAGGDGFDAIGGP